MESESDLDQLQVLQIETTNYCNANCIFCAYNKIKKHGNMSDQLYNKILVEATQLPALRAFIPLLTGEPMCDKKIVPRVQQARRVLGPIVEIRFYTNGSLLTEEVLDAFAEIPQFYLTVSLNAFYAETRKKLMRIDDFEHVVRMIQYAAEIGIPQQVGMVNHPDISDDEKKAFQAHGGVLASYDNWSGIQYEYNRPADLKPCRRALHHMPIKYDGSVPLCCFDPWCTIDGKGYVDITSVTIPEAWDHLRFARDMHREGMGHLMKACKHCTHNVKCDTDETRDEYLYQTIDRL